MIIVDILIQLHTRALARCVRLLKQRPLSLEISWGVRMSTFVNNHHGAPTHDHRCYPILLSRCKEYSCMCNYIYCITQLLHTQ